jgi:hypothetical protein
MLVALMSSTLAVSEEAGLAVVAVDDCPLAARLDEGVAAEDWGEGSSSALASSGDVNELGCKNHAVHSSLWKWI